MSNLIRPSEHPVVSPTPATPLYMFGEEDEQERHNKQQELLRQAVNVVTSDTGFKATEEVRQLLRQTGMVNLFFFLRFVAGYANAFTRLTPTLHQDMCNFYQVTRVPGIRAAGFLSRKHFKSTVWTYGGSLWDITRNPDWEEVLASCIKERGIEFNGYVQEVLEANELYAWLYPEYVPDEGRNLNHNSEMTRVPNKKGRRPNIKIVGVGASIQGVHARDSFKTDDLVGEHMLDSMNHLGADNQKAKNWFGSAVENIPSGRGCVVTAWGTRYGPDDAWGPIWSDIKKFYGYTEAEPFEEKADGSWVVYYRAVREDQGDGRGERPVFPEEITNDELDKMMLEKPWQYWTQMMNMSAYSGLSEMIDYDLKTCNLDVSKGGELIVSWFDSAEQRLMEEPLADMDVVAACDPAASEKRVSVRTSKSAYVVYARNWRDQRFVLQVESGFAPITQVFDWLFAGFKRFKGYVRTTNVEVQGPFKMLRPIIRDEEHKRQMWLNFRGVSAKGDKDGRIRAYLQPLMERGELYAVESAQAVIRGEMSTFPDGHQKDVLDALAIAEAASRRGDAPDDVDEDDVWEQTSEERSAVTGY